MRITKQWETDVINANITLMRIIAKNKGYANHESMWNCTYWEYNSNANHCEKRRHTMYVCMYVCDVCMYITWMRITAKNDNMRMAILIQGEHRRNANITLMRITVKNEAIWSSRQLYIMKKKMFDCSMVWLNTSSVHNEETTVIYLFIY
jgi:hypothetical protein